MAAEASCLACWLIHVPPDDWSCSGWGWSGYHVCLRPGPLTTLVSQLSSCSFPRCSAAAFHATQSVLYVQPDCPCNAAGALLALLAEHTRPAGLLLELDPIRSPDELAALESKYMDAATAGQATYLHGLTTAVQ